MLTLILLVILLWIVVTVVLAFSNLTPLAVVIPVLLYTGLSILALVLSRRIIVRAKRDGNWFEGVPVRVSAQLTAPPYHHPPIVWPALAAVVLSESLTGAKFGGMFLVLSGVVLISISN